MTNGYERSIQIAREHLNQADELAGFCFAAQSGDQISVALGQQPEEGEVDYVNLVAKLLQSLNAESGIHPARLGHAAVQQAVDHADSDALSVRWDVNAEEHRGNGESE